MCGMKKPDGKGDSRTESYTEKENTTWAGWCFLKEKVKMLEGTMNKIFMFYAWLLYRINACNMSANSYNNIKKS